MLNTPVSVPAFPNGVSAVTKGRHRYRLPNLQTKLAANGIQPTASSPEIKHDNLDNKGGIYKIVLGFCVILALVVGSVHLVARYTGAEIARAGHTIKTQLRTVILGQDVIMIPENMIRYPSQRRMAELDRLDLYLHWPSMSGYSPQLKTVFNEIENNQAIIFVTLEPRFSTLDMTGRIEPIYRQFTVGEAAVFSDSLVIHSLDAAAGFIDEALIVQKNSPYPFSARCIMNPKGNTTPYCIRDIHIGKNLSLTYRFHKGLLTDWLALDRSMRNKFKAMIN